MPIRLSVTEERVRRRLAAIFGDSLIGKKIGLPASSITKRRGRTGRRRGAQRSARSLQFPRSRVGQRYPRSRSPRRLRWESRHSLEAGRRIGAR